MAEKKRKKAGTQPQPENNKIADLAPHMESGTDQFLTTNHGVRINDNNNTLKAGERGPSLLEDFIMREKITHFDHERIPERIVHARGAGAHGIFKVYESMERYTKANFLCDPTLETPVFVRFSTVAGSRGSSDLARDVRGFAVKFYTQEGNFDLVGNNMPVFFIQDAMKFPDLVHAVKPEPNNEIPQAASAHDTFWDFISLMPESMHMVMWVMSDRAIPRSYRTMEGFGVHTFRLINAEGEATFVKFHWKPLLGVHSVAWDEAQKISGKDPDFHRRDLWDAINKGAFPEWEFGVQLVPEKDEFKFSFDLLDPTKLIPEELVPVQRIGKLTLNRNPTNFFAETEQIAYHVGHVVPGIDFTNDPLLQGRLFSYLDTQLKRLGGPNFHEIPINRPIAPAHNNQRDGHMRQTINEGQVSYHPNSLGGGCPFQAGMKDGGFVSHVEKIEASKVRERSPSFFDHFSQATLFFHSQSESEQNHLVDALRFELGKVTVEAIRERMLGLLTQVDTTLAKRVADGLGMPVPQAPLKPMNHGVGADADPKATEPTKQAPPIEKSSALSMENQPQSAKTRQVAMLVADGVDAAAVNAMKQTLEDAGAACAIIAPHLGFILAKDGSQLKVDQSLLTAASVLFDAVYVPGGSDSIDALLAEANALHFINEAYRHCKPVAADDEGVELLRATYVNNELGADPETTADPAMLAEGGVIIGSARRTKGHHQGDTPAALIEAIAKHRFWARETDRLVPA